MKKVVGLILFSMVLAMTIQGSVSEEALPSCQPNIYDCVPFDNVQSTFSVSAEEVSSTSDSYWGGEDSSERLISDTSEAIYAEPVVYEDSDEETFADSRIELSESYFNKPSSHLYELSPQSIKNSFEERASQLLKKVKLYKAHLGKGTDLPKESYSSSVQEYSTLEKEFTSRISEDTQLFNDVEEEIEILRTLFSMIDLNNAMRSQGCSSQLQLDDSQDDDEVISPRPRQSILKLLINKLEKFVVAMSQCYDEDDHPRIHDDEFGAVVDHISVQFETLEGQFKEFLAQDTILSRIFKDELKLIETEISQLLLFADEQYRKEYGELQEDDSAGSVNTQKCHFQAAEEQQAKTLGEMQRRLESAHEFQYHDSQYLNFEKYRTWRDGLNSASDVVISHLAKANYPNSCEKHNVEILLESILQDVTTKTNSALLLAVEMTTRETDDDDETLGLYSNFYEIIKADIDYVDARLKQILRNLERIEDTVCALGVVEAKEHTKVQRALLEQTSKHLKAVQWAMFPESQKYTVMEAKAFEILERVETFSKHGSC